jgi:hypothetical protein
MGMRLHKTRQQHVAPQINQLGIGQRLLAVGPITHSGDAAVAAHRHRRGLWLSRVQGEDAGGHQDAGVVQGHGWGPLLMLTAIL